MEEKSVLFALPGRHGDTIIGSMVANMLIEQGYDVTWVTIPYYAALTRLVCERAKLSILSDPPQTVWRSFTTSQLPIDFPGYRYYINAQPGSQEYHDKCVTSGKHIAWFVKEIAETAIGEKLPEDFIKYLTITQNDQKGQGIRVAGDMPQGFDLTEVSGGSEFSRAIRSIIAQDKPSKIIETGTFHGTGTTTTIASALRDYGVAAKFFTIEVNPNNYAIAENNLSSAGLLSHVTMLNGMSVPWNLVPTRESIENSCIKNIEFSNIFVDHPESNRVNLYFQETNFPSLPEDLLGQCLTTFDDRPDFVLLDSGGHMGYIEFQYLISRLKGPCVIALDDTYHIKHHKSMLFMQKDKRFEILVTSHEKFGFCIARFHPETTEGYRSLDSIDWPKDKPLAIIAPEVVSLPKNVLPKSHIDELYQKYSQEYHVRILVKNNPGIEQEKYIYGISFEDCLFLIKKAGLFIGNDSGLAWASLYSKCKKIIYHSQERVDQTHCLFSQIDSSIQDIIIPRGQA